MRRTRRVALGMVAGMAVAVVSGLLGVSCASAAAVTDLSSPVVSKVVGVTTNLNVRDQPSTSGAVIAWLYNGDSFNVTGYTADGWLKMNASGVSLGYVSADWVNVPVVSLTADAAQAQVMLGSTLRVSMTLFPACASNTAMSWSSSDSTVASVDSSGLVTGKKLGTVTVTGKTADGGKTATTTVRVVPVPVGSVSVSPATASLVPGGTVSLTATVNPSDATDKSVSWASSDATVASVDASGVVTAKKGGTATITVKTADGGKTATSRVTVVVAVASVSLPATAKADVGGTVTLTATVSPSDATDKSVSWSSNDTAVATVSASGVVTGKQVGTATITVKTADGGKTATTTVTVSKTVPVSSVSVTPATAKVTVGSKASLTVSVSPSDATNKTVAWSSSDTTVATVDATGAVTAKKAGTATITVRTADGAKTATVKVTVVEASTLALTGGMAVPDPLPLRTPVTVKGVVKSNYNITQVAANITDKNGNVVYGKTVTPNATSYDLNKLDNILLFSKLAEGTYTYTVTASDAYPTSNKVLHKVTFKVGTGKAASTLSLSGGMSVPNPLTPGTPVTVKGTVTSNYTITSVTAKIVNAAGNMVYGKTVSPNATSYNLGNLDAILKFSGLTPGTYTYTVIASDSYPTSNKPLHSVTFKVGASSTAASTLALSGSMSIPDPLTPGRAVTVKGTVTSNYTITSVTAKITTSSGVVKYTQTAKPNAKSFNLGTMDAALKFSQLTTGTYTYTVIASDTYPTNNKVLRNVAFQVGPGTPPPTTTTGATNTVQNTTNSANPGARITSTAIYLSLDSKADGITGCKYGTVPKEPGVKPVDGSGCKGPGAPPQYVEARKKFGTVGTNSILNWGGDCGNFVGTVLRASGVDPSYPANYTGTQIKYLRESPKWKKIDNKQNASNLMPGDVFIVGIDPRPRHTFLYIGDGRMAQASMGEQMPWHGGAVRYSETRWSEKDKKNKTYLYEIYRYVG